MSAKLDSIKFPSLTGLESKIEKVIEDKMEKVIGPKIEMDLQFLIEQLSLETLEIDSGKERIKELEVIVENKDNTIEHLHNKCAELNLQLEQFQLSKIGR